MSAFLRLICGLLAVGLAVAGQHRLEAGYIFDALFFYAAGILLLLGTFARAQIPELDPNAASRTPSTEADGSLRGWKEYLSISFLVGLGLATAALTLIQFNQDTERPAPFTWPLYGLSIGLILVAAALLDGAHVKLRDHLRTRLQQSPGVRGGLISAPQRLPAQLLTIVRAFIFWLGDLVGACERTEGSRSEQSERPHPPYPHTYAVDEPIQKKSAPWLAVHTILFAAILLLAFLMRIYRYREWPFGTWYDEAAAGLFALRMVQDPEWRPIFPGSINITGHYTYLVAKSVEWFGPTTQAVRWVSVLLGMSAVPAAYFAGRELFGRTVGLLVMFFIALSRWHVNFSRIGMFNIATPLFALIAVAYLHLALRRNRCFDFALAGLSFGLGLCFYPAFQLFVVAAALYLLYQILSVRGFLQRYWYGLAVVTVTMTLVVSPLALFAYKKSDVYFARTQETSLLANKTQEERLPALLENSRKHLLMFNYKGDPNGRHNLPGEPMLDPVTASLMVLGLAFCLTRMWRPRVFLLVVWFILALLGGILSLDFEAPQSLRSIATLPVVYLFAAVPVYLIWTEWTRSAARYFPRSFASVILLLVIPMGWSNYHTYFKRQAKDFASWNAYSTPETITAKALNDLPENTEAYVISYFHGHPTIGYLAKDAKPFRRLETTDHLPLPWPQDKDILLLMNAESRSLFDEAKRFYPEAVFEEVKPPFGGPAVVYKVLLTKSDIQSIQGLTGVYYANANWTGTPELIRKDSQIAFDWGIERPIDAPFSVEWRGIMRIEHYGQHQLVLQAPAAAELFIGEERVLASDANQEATALVLAEGNHSIRLRAQGASGLITLAWRPPDRTHEVVPSRVLFTSPVTSNGLLGNYYPNGDWEGTPTLARIDAHFNLYFHVPPLKRPYTAEWIGKIGIPTTGTYAFGLESIDESILYIDEQEIVASRERNQYRQETVHLDEGLHDVRLRFADRTDHTHVNFYWIPPGGRRQIVPPEVLFPPQGSYERVSIPSLRQLNFDPQNPRQISLVIPVLGGTAEAHVEGLDRPAGIAVAGNGLLFVADLAEKKVLGYSHDGVQVLQIEGLYSENEWRPFEEPFDLALDELNRLYVLDSGLGLLARFNQNGIFETTLPIPQALLLRARGLDVDTEERIWIPATAAGRIAAFDTTGSQLLDFSVWPDKAAQPVDVVALPSGELLVADAGIHKLIRYDSDGTRLLAWDIPLANTMQGPHLAVDSEGFIYLTEPEKARIAKLNPDGERIGEWMLESRNGEPAKPVGIAVDSTGRIWYTDGGLGTISSITPRE